jgi:hypothetical protein
MSENGWTLVVLAAGVGSRYGGTKQLDTVGPAGETLSDYALYDAVRCGASAAVFVIRPDLEELFRAHHARWGGRVSIGYAYQRLDALPPGFRLPPGRTKPWGTTHAVLAAADLLPGPFAVINADDFYGRDAFVTLGRFLSGSPRLPTTIGLVPYPLRETLSIHGGVSRGILEVDAAGQLVRITEETDIASHGGRLTGRRGETEVLLHGDEPVSMNCWGFPPAALSLLAAQFTRFLEGNGKSVTAECPLPDSVQAVLETGTVSVRVLAGARHWFGVTHPADRPVVVERLRHLTEAGHYPAGLFDAG